MRYRKENFSNEKFYRVNEKIKFSPVIVIDQNGDNLGKFHVEKAREFARRENLDLVEVSPNSRPPICKIMDFGKFKYEKSLKEKKQKSSKKQTQKEIRLSCNIAENDLNTKANMVINFLKNNHKVQVKLEYRRRQNSHKELGFEVINKMIEKVSEFSSPVEKPKLEGNVLLCQFHPKV
jgi:translation initiation factor IF-3